MGETLQQLQDRRTKVQAAYDKALEAQQYSVSGQGGAGRTVVRVDLAALSKELDKLDGLIAAASRGGVRVRQAVPRDN